MSAHANLYLLLDTCSFESVIEKIDIFTFTRKKIHQDNTKACCLNAMGATLFLLTLCMLGHAFVVVC